MQDLASRVTRADGTRETAVFILCAPLVPSFSRRTQPSALARTHGGSNPCSGLCAARRMGGLAEWLENGGDANDGPQKATRCFVF